jgi:hypothetical protein
MFKPSRDPALYLTAFMTLVRLGAAFGLNFSDEQQAWLNAGATAAAGVIVAIWVRRDGQVAAVLGFIQAMLALAAGFGAHLSAENQALIMSAIGALAAAFVRTQVVAPVSALGDRQP